jgi:hypothetical protein
LPARFAGLKLPAAPVDKHFDSPTLEQHCDGMELPTQGREYPQLNIHKLAVF